MNNIDDRRRGPSKTELKQQELREVLHLSEDLHELESNARTLLRSVLLNRDIPETQYLIDVVRRAKEIYLTEGR
ncbi:hypothetical protein [Streptomyces massasporeus]|uniref:hypothetical protein n=1 Tax=Streptomyces massasporeus TaxID=67324 RepID=UPI0016790CEE|nr:hypothetical protein [Streptomyces massasporeus]GGV64531.1 hypothetical protein GCM10010228_15280 [Streptomyces massasporeus]